MFSITEWLEAPGHISVAVDCLALGGCAFTTYVAYRATKARDRMEALCVMARNILAERGTQVTQPLPAAEDEGPVIVRVPITTPQAVDPTRMDLRQWVVPSAEQMAAWNRFGSNGRVDG